MMLLWTSVALGLVVQCCWCVPLDEFFPFGVDEGDLAVSPANGFASHVLSEDFIFYDEARRILHVRMYTYTCIANSPILCCI